MTLVRSLFSAILPGDPPADAITHVVYHTVDTGGVLPAVDYASHATEVLAAFNGGTDDSSFQNYTRWNTEVRCYDMADNEPRPVLGSARTDASMPKTRDALGPEQVALCLAFYAGRNITGSRSRLFIGGWNKVDMTERPTTGILGTLLDLGHALHKVGGTNVAMVIRTTGIPGAHAKGTRPTYGPTKSGHAANSTQEVTDFWVDNRWDTVKKRLRKADARQTLHP